MNILRNFTQKQSSDPENMNNTIHNTTDHKFNHPENKPVFEMPSQQEEKSEDNRCKLSKRNKIIIGIFSAVVVFVLALGLGLGLTLGPNAKIVPAGQPFVMQGADGNNVATQEVQFQQVSRWRPRPPRLDVQIFANIRVSVPLPIPSQARNLQEGDSIPDDYMIHVELKDMGIINSIAPNGSISINLNVDKFVDHLENQVSPEQRLLAEAQIETGELYTIDDVKEELGQVIRQAFDVQSTVKFETNEFDTWVKNDTTGNFQIENETSSRLLTTRKLWGGKLWKRIRPYVAPAIIAVAKPVTQAVKESQKEIAEVVRDIKTDAQKIANSSSKIEAVIKTCIPKGSKKFMCINKDGKNKNNGKRRPKLLTTTI